VAQQDFNSFLETGGGSTPALGTNRINILTTVFVRKYNHAGVYSIASLIFGIVRELGLRCIPSISRQFVVAAKLDVLKKHAFCKVI